MHPFSAPIIYTSSVILISLLNNTPGVILNSVTGEQIRAARALVRWEQADLASAAGVSLETIKRLEGTRGPVSAHARTLDAIKAALAEVGVVFIDSNGQGPGVRLREPGE